MTAGAGAISTLNTRDFPAATLPPGIRKMHPAVFALTTVSLDPQRALQAIGMIAARSGTSGPRRTVDGILDLLVERYHFHDVVTVLRTTSPLPPPDR